jgi:hypothetical protein
MTGPVGQALSGFFRFPAPRDPRPADNCRCGPGASTGSTSRLLRPWLRVPYAPSRSTYPMLALSSCFRSSIGPCGSRSSEEAAPLFCHARRNPRERNAPGDHRSCLARPSMDPVRVRSNKCCSFAGSQRAVCMAHGEDRGREVLQELARSIGLNRRCFAPSERGESTAGRQSRSFAAA